MQNTVSSLQMYLWLAVEVCASLKFKWLCARVCVCVTVFFALYQYWQNSSYHSPSREQRGWHMLAWCLNVGRPIISH